MEDAARSKRNKIYAKDYVGWWGYSLLEFFFSLMPWKLAYLIAGIASRILYRTAGINRRIIEGNLRMAFDFDKKRTKKYTRRIFKHFCLNTVDFLRFQKFDERWFKRNVTVVGLENLSKAFKLGRGVIAIALHMGNWELGAYLTHLAGFPVNGIWASHRNPRLDEFFLKRRLEKGVNVIFTGGALKKSLEALARNELVFFVVDHSYDKKGAVIDFLGHKAIIPIGAAVAAIKSNAPIIPFVPIRMGGLRYKAFYGEPIEYSLTGDKEKDVLTICRASIKAMEPYIKAHPDQWLLFRKYWSE